MQQSPHTSPVFLPAYTLDDISEADLEIYHSTINGSLEHILFSFYYRVTLLHSLLFSTTVQNSCDHSKLVVAVVVGKFDEVSPVPCSG